MGDLNIVQIAVTAVITAGASGVVTGLVGQITLKAVFGEFKEDIKRRVQSVEEKVEIKVDKSACSTNHSESKVLKSDCKDAMTQNEKEHTEIFDRLRATELGLVAVKKSQLEG
jgi:hypothetical protein